MADSTVLVVWCCVGGVVTVVLCRWCGHFGGGVVIVVLCGWCGYWCCVGGVVTGVVRVVWSLVLCGWCGHWCCAGGVVTGVWVVWSLVLRGWCGHWCCVGGVVTGVVRAVCAGRDEIRAAGRRPRPGVLLPQPRDRSHLAEEAPYPGIASLRHGQSSATCQYMHVSDTISQAEHVSACTSQTQEIKRNISVHVILRHSQ